MKTTPSGVTLTHRFLPPQIEQNYGGCSLKINVLGADIWGYRQATMTMLQ